MMLENFILILSCAMVNRFIGQRTPILGEIVLFRTIDDVARPYLHYPSGIQNALMRIETHPTFRSLTKSALLVLKALVTRASASNGTTIIRARLDRVADEAKVSYKTAQRAMRVFNEFDWVSQASDGRSEYGVYESKRYRLSPVLCELIQLPTKEKSAAALAQETEMSDGAVYADLSLKKDLREISIENRKGAPPPLPPAVAHVPEQTGISPTGVCKLMGIARKAGHQLEHVVTIAKPYLSKIGAASPGRSYQYLLAMLLNPKPVDYAGKVAQLERLATGEKRAKSAKEMAARCRFKRFTHITKAGLRVRFFDGIAEVTADGQSATLVGAQLDVLYADVASGKLLEVMD